MYPLLSELGDHRVRTSWSVPPPREQPHQRVLSEVVYQRLQVARAHDVCDAAVIKLILQTSVAHKSRQASPLNGNRKLTEMIHPHSAWTSERLRSYKGTTETLTLEFKSYRSLVADDKRGKAARIAEAAKDVAAMANEQGGVIIYGQEEKKTGQQRQATDLIGFGPEHTEISREWFLQFIRDRVHLSLPDIDAVQVEVGDRGEFALVVLIPQARGTARQTDDKLFWRRDAQGMHSMSVQEIEDVRGRTILPTLELSAVLTVPSTTTQTGCQGTHELSLQFRARNVSSATANFAVLTVAGVQGVGINFISNPEWHRLETDQSRHVVRCALAMGNSSRWSPITPAFTIAYQELRVKFEALTVDRFQPRIIGHARVDHEGGAALYAVNFWKPSDFQLILEQWNAEVAWTSRVPALLTLS